MVISRESIKYSLNNIKKSKARSILTVLSIFVGIATIFIFVSYGWGLYDYIDEFTSSSSADKLLIQPKGGTIPGLDDTFKLLDGKTLERKVIPLYRDGVLVGRIAHIKDITNAG